MPRAHVEFVQSQNVDWRPSEEAGLTAGGQVKVFARDEVEGALTGLVSVEPGWHKPLVSRRDLAAEIYVLEGVATIHGQPLYRHSYVRTRVDDVLHAGERTVLLVFLDPDPDAATTDREAAPRILHCPRMPWDTSIADPKLGYLNVGRKVLHKSDDGRTSSYLISGLPLGYVADGELPYEKHPHAEEMFLIYGEISSLFGVMTTGAYFYRPPGAIHGHNVSEYGFLMLVRIPGSNTFVNQWSSEAHRIEPDPVFQPILPPDSPAVWKRPLPTKPQY